MKNLAQPSPARENPRMSFSRLRRVLLALALLAFLFVPFSGFLVARASSGRIYSNLYQVPHRTVGVLLGCVRGVPGGGVNPFFTERVDATARLFLAGKIDYILVSGDNNNNSYNEPLDMRDALIAAKVPRDRIYMDYAGFRTLDSVVRAKEVFGLQQFTIISQGFHTPRAVYLAEHHGIDAIAFNANSVAFQFSYDTLFREHFARAKCVLDIAFGKRPRFLGSAVRIGVDPPVEPTSGSRR
jgi:SanA protein